MLFVYEIIKYNITNEESARFKKINYNSNYRQNTLAIDLKGDKYRIHEHCVHEVSTEMQASGKNGVCVPYVDKFKNVNG